MYWTYLESPIGNLTLSSDGASLTGLWMESHCSLPHFLNTAFYPNLLLFKQVSIWLGKYFEGIPQALTLPWAVTLSPF